MMAEAALRIDQFAPIVPEEDRELAGAGKQSFARLVARLSHQSVVKHFDAYADVDWDSEEFRIDPRDPRWELSGDDSLGASDWYRSQPPEVRSRIGLHMVANFMKIGLQFEGLLKRGLLEFAETLPNRSPEFRYIYHEVGEEVQHSLMFQEFVNRSGVDVPGLSGFFRFLGRFIVRLGTLFPELFFFFVLGGEDPIDHVQRKLLRKDRAVHPLLRRIMQIHVTEEARHLCFARHHLKQHVPALGRFRRLLLAIGAPFILGIMAQLMMQPSAEIIREYDIADDVIAEAYTHNPRHRANTLEALTKIRSLCVELGLITGASRRLWQALGIWSEVAA